MVTAATVDAHMLTAMLKGNFGTWRNIRRLVPTNSLLHTELQRLFAM